MELSLLTEMHRNIDYYIEQGVFANKEIVIFGSNEAAEKMMDYLKGKGFLTSHIVDNNPKKNGTFLYGIPVSQPNQYLLPKRTNCVILIASRYYPEMLLQLESIGYEEGKEILKAAEYSGQHANSLTEQEFDERVQIVKRGELIYKDILVGTPGLQKLFICTPAELGSTYVGMAYMRQYNKKNGIQSFHIVGWGSACSKIGYLFGYENQISCINKEDMEALLQYAVFSNMADKKILVMNHRYPYICRVGEIGNYKGINFLDHFCYSIFELGESAGPEVPYVHRDNDQAKHYVSSLFEKEHLEKGKTVILMPYANTAPQIRMEFWTELVARLKEQGYIVCTNSSGDIEPPIEGTKPLFFDLRYGLEVVEAAGIMIALRSGLCDVLSSAKAKKIIIYPDRIYGPGRFIDFYNLVGLGLSKEADEFEWNGDVEQMLEMVLDRIPFCL